MDNQKKKSLKWLWILIAIAVVVGITVWCIVSAVNNPKTVLGVTVKEGIENVLNFSSTFA